MLHTDPNGQSSTEVDHTEATTLWRGFVTWSRKYVWVVIAFVGTIAALGIALTVLYLTLDSTREIHQMMFDVSMTLVAVSIVVLFMGIAVGQAFKRDVEGYSNTVLSSLRREIDSAKELVQEGSDTLREVLREGVAVELAESADDIWDHSVRMLEDLASSPMGGYAFDVSTYINKIRYEESAVRVLDEEKQFLRIFCFDRKSSAETDLALAWFFDVVTANEELGERADLDLFKMEICRALKDRQDEKEPESVTVADYDRLKRVINKQREAHKKGYLRMKEINYHLHNDFVGISCIRESLAGGRITRAEQCEVMTNFKTDLRGETYVAGIRGTGLLGLSYRDFFRNILWGTR